MPGSSLETRAIRYGYTKNICGRNTSAHQIRFRSTASHMEYTSRSTGSSMYLPSIRTMCGRVCSAPPADSSTSLGRIEGIRTSCCTVCTSVRGSSNTALVRTAGLHTTSRSVCTSALLDNSTGLVRTAVCSILRNLTRTACRRSCIAFLQRVGQEDRTASLILHSTCTTVRPCMSRSSTSSIPGCHARTRRRPVTPAIAAEFQCQSRRTHFGLSIHVSLTSLGFRQKQAEGLATHWPVCGHMNEPSPPHRSPQYLMSVTQCDRLPGHGTDPRGHESHAHGVDLQISPSSGSKAPLESRSMPQKY